MKIKPISANWLLLWSFVSMVLSFGLIGVAMFSRYWKAYPLALLLGGWCHYLGRHWPINLDRKVSRGLQQSIDLATGLLAESIAAILVLLLIFHPYQSWPWRLLGGLALVLAVFGPPSLADRLRKLGISRDAEFELAQRHERMEKAKTGAA